MITIKQITYALAVAKHKHFKKASEACHVSQSALSTAISELESQLKMQIFERDNKKVLITPVGELFLEKALRVKMEVDDIYQLSKSLSEPLSFPLSIGVIPTIGPYLLPKVLPRVRAEFPKLQLKIVEDQSHTLVDKVRRGELDTAILALPYPLENLHAFEFWQEDFFIVTHQSTSYAGMNEISSEQLRESQLLLLEDGHCLKDQALAVCSFQTGKIDHSFSGTSLYTLIEMVAGKMGQTLVPEMALDSLLDKNVELKAIHLNEPGPHRRLAFITRLNYANVSNIEILIKLFKQQLA